MTTPPPYGGAREMVARAAGETGPLAALTALNWSFAWAVEVLRVTGSPDDLTAFECVVVLDEALARVDALEREVSGLLDLAMAGEAVKDHARDRQLELGRLREIVARERANLQGRRRDEEELRMLEAEHRTLRTRLDDIDRLERLAAELETMRAQSDALEGRMTAVGVAADAEDRLRDASHELLILTEEQRGLLSAETRRFVEEAARAQRALSAERERAEKDRKALEEAVAGFEELRSRGADRLSALRAYHEADRALFQAVTADRPVAGEPGPWPGAEQVGRALSEIDQRLGEVDRALGAAVERHRGTYQEARALVSWADRP
ncbi:hypothetical protein [Streptosporangium sp. NPDC051022]|uniref:hypothetical protein n=1 Tax=Streptosporangium sp. NPDC051022 TaxID=3155752 RepID=UPI003423AE1D